MKPGITLAMIVKDDAVRLRRCLESVRAVVDDMVVVDTGSSDGTPDVAAELGARVHRMEWPGAFDAALNEALDRVETEWTLRLDSDEWFEGDSARALIDLTRDDRVFGYFLIRRDFYDDRPFSEMQLLRLWRTHPQIRYHGIVHEVIRPEDIIAVAGERRTVAAPVVLLHDGYTGGSLRSKRLRNIALLERELESRPNDIHYQLSLAEALVAENDPKGFSLANELADRILETPEKKQDAPMAPWALGISLELTPDDQLFSARTQKLIRYILRWHNDNVVGMWAIATTELKRNNLMHSYQALLELEEMGQTGDYDRLAPVPSVFITFGAWEYLGNVAMRLGKKAVAKRNFERLLAMNPAHQGAAQALRELG